MGIYFKKTYPLWEYLFKKHTLCGNIRLKNISFGTICLINISFVGQLNKWKQSMSNIKSTIFHSFSVFNPHVAEKYFQPHLLSYITFTVWSWKKVKTLKLESVDSPLQFFWPRYQYLKATNIIIISGLKTIFILVTVHIWFPCYKISVWIRCKCWISLPDKLWGNLHCLLASQSDLC